MGEPLLIKVMHFGHKRGVKDIEHQIHKVIKKKRLMFLPNKRFAFIEKSGAKGEYEIHDMVRKAIDAGNWRKNMDALGITDQEINNILMSEYQKNFKGAK